MRKAILATKVGMTQIFNEDGTLIPVTVLPEDLLRYFFIKLSLVKAYSK